jgi:hypothetical protein
MPTWDREHCPWRGAIQQINVKTLLARKDLFRRIGQRCRVRFASPELPSVSRNSQASAQQRGRSLPLSGEEGSLEMASFHFRKDWDDSRNHDSSLNKEEVQAILLAVPNIAGIAKDPQKYKDSEAMYKIAQLVQCLDNPKSPSTVSIHKGIHPNARGGVGMHITVYCERIGGAGAYHVWIEAGAAVFVKSGVNDAGNSASVTLKKWKPTGISYIINHVEIKSPAQFSIGRGLGLQRRGSFSIGNSNAIAAYVPTYLDVKQGQLVRPQADGDSYGQRR